MCTTIKWKTGILVVAMALVCGSANAQHWHRHYYYRPDRVVTVVVQPDVTSYVSNPFNQKERLAMAIAYLETHKHLGIRQYAKMTRLSMAAAEAELDAFAMDKKKAYTTYYQRKKESVYKKTIVYEADLEITGFRNGCYVFAAIMCDRAPVPPPSPSQTLFCRYATDNRYDLV